MCLSTRFRRSCPSGPGPVHAAGKRGEAAPAVSLSLLKAQSWSARNLPLPACGLPCTAVPICWVLSVPLFIPLLLMLVPVPPMSSPSICPKLPPPPYTPTAMAPARNALQSCFSGWRVLPPTCSGGDPVIVSSSSSRFVATSSFMGEEFPVT